MLSFLFYIRYDGTLGSVPYEFEDDALKVKKKVSYRYYNNYTYLD